MKRRFVFIFGLLCMTIMEVLAMDYHIERSETTNNALASRLYSSEPLMKRIGEAAHSLIVGRVKNGVAPANAPLTKNVKQGDKPLMDSGRLVASLHWRASTAEAVVSSNHRAAVMNNPPEGDSATTIEITPKKAKSLCLPAGYKTRTLMRRYGFSPREVLDGLRADGYTVFMPKKAGSNARSNVIMAQLPAVKTKSGKDSTGKRYEAFPVFILSKKVTIPIRRFMYLTETELQQIDRIVEDYYAA